MALGAAMAGGNPSQGRQKNDWYPTPPDVTLALLRGSAFHGDVWEPCCGDGAMARVIEENGHRVFATDLVARGFGNEHGEDWDVLKVKSLPAPNVITNPPFKIAAAMIRHVLGLKPDYLAMVLKSTYWQAKRRTPLFREHPPAAVFGLTWRPDFMKRKRPTMDVIWTVWRKDWSGPTVYDLLPRPAEFLRQPR